jgi:SAM-dependent methyltransferase
MGQRHTDDAALAFTAQMGNGSYDRSEWAPGVSYTITGESCACPTPTAPTRKAIILDPFAGTGTVPAVANALGRYGVGIDLSADYLRLARWRCQDPGLQTPAYTEWVGTQLLAHLKAAA